MRTRSTTFTTRRRSTQSFSTAACWSGRISTRCSRKARRSSMDIERVFEYDAWANREEVRHLRELATPPPNAMKILAHILGTEWLFLGRLRRDPKPAIVWPDLTLDQ